MQRSEATDLNHSLSRRVKGPNVSLWSFLSWLFISALTRNFRVWLSRRGSITVSLEIVIFASKAYLTPNVVCNNVAIPDTKNIVLRISLMTSLLPWKHIGICRMKGIANVDPNMVRKCWKYWKNVNQDKHCRYFSICSYQDWVDYISCCS